MTDRVSPRVPYFTRRRPGLCTGCVCEADFCFGVPLYFIYRPILLPTTHCLAAGIAGGWHLLPEPGWCGTDLWAKKRPVGVRDRCLGPRWRTLYKTLCDILYVFTTFAERQKYVGSGISPWWLVCVRYSPLCSGERPVGMKDWRFCLIWCSALTPALCQLGCLLSAWQKKYVNWSTSCKVTVIELCALSKNIAALLPPAEKLFGYTAWVY